jgi:hypothetical protein
MEVVYWLSNAYEHIIKKSKKNRTVKISKESFRSAYGHSIFVHNFLEKIIIFCVIYVTRQKRPRE